MIVLVGAYLEGLLVIGWYFPGTLVIIVALIVAAAGAVALRRRPRRRGHRACFCAYVTNFLAGKYGWYRLLLAFGLREPLDNAQKRLTNTA